MNLPRPLSDVQILITLSYIIEQPHFSFSTPGPAPPPPPPPPVAQNLANSGLAAAGGGGTGLLGTDELRSSLLSEIKAVGGSGFRGLRPVRPEGITHRNARPGS